MYLNDSIERVENKPLRQRKKFSLVDTFKLSNVKKDVEIEGFAEPSILTPAVDPYFRFQKYELTVFLQALEYRENTYLVGHSGTGKTALVNQVAARLNYNVVQINFDGHLSRADLIGDWKLRNGDMFFRYGLLPIAFTEPGTIVLFDEIDACQPETAFVLQRALSNDKQFLMHETNQLVSLHPQNVIVGTANTTGMGDDTALYTAGTNVQNFSFLNRWKTVIQVDYLSQEAELVMLKAMFPSLDPDKVVKPVVSILHNVRTAFKAGTVSVPLTTRDGINWLEKLTRVPLPLYTARASFLDKLSYTDAVAIANLIQRNFSITDKDDKKWMIKRS